MSDYLVFRIYRRIPKENHRLLGVVHASDAPTALEKAQRGEWKHFYGQPTVESDFENWVAIA